MLARTLTQFCSALALTALIHYSVTRFEIAFQTFWHFWKSEHSFFLSEQPREGTVADEDAQKSYFTCTAVRSCRTTSEVIQLCTVIGMPKCEQNTLRKEIKQDSGEKKRHAHTCVYSRHIFREKFEQKARAVIISIVRNNNEITCVSRC